MVNVDLGGATNRFKSTQYTYGKNKVSITTPSTLSTDYLSIYGETNKIKDIMLIQGDVNQHPEYFDGTQSTGELQGDGSYKIDILSLSEILDGRVKSHNVSILLDSPLTNDDKIYYDNGYKVSRNGSIETPVIKGDEINLPKLYQGINTYTNTTTGNIKPSEIKVQYKEFK